jgi:MinD-like ATPase involved in chromosome partitioning or flagellar assembly
MGAGDWQADVLRQLRDEAAPRPTTAVPGPTPAGLPPTAAAPAALGPKALGPGAPGLPEAAGHLEVSGPEAPGSEALGLPEAASHLETPGPQALGSPETVGHAETPARPETLPRPEAIPRQHPHSHRQSHPKPPPRPGPHPQPRPRHLPTPVPLRTLDPALDGMQGRPRSGDSPARRAGRFLRGLVTASRDVEEATRIARALQQPLHTGRQIAVTSIRGGAGKTTVAALLNLTYSHYRRRPVLVLEADPTLGTLPIRLGAEAIRWTCGDLAQVVTPSMQFAEVTGYLVPVREGGWLLPGSQGRIGAPLDIAGYRAVTAVLRRHFDITVVDCETLPGELARTALDTAQARVLVAPTTVEGVASTYRVLEWMARVPRPMLPGTVVALTASAPDVTLDTEAAARQLAEFGARVVVLPYDRHLGSGGPIRTAMLGGRIRLAAGRLAAALLDKPEPGSGGRA